MFGQVILMKEFRGSKKISKIDLIFLVFVIIEELI